jgi:hypothetical protein
MEVREVEGNQKCILSGLFFQLFDLLIALCRIPSHIYLVIPCGVLLTPGTTSDKDNLVRHVDHIVQVHCLLLMIVQVV